MLKLCFVCGETSDNDEYWFYINQVSGSGETYPICSCECLRDFAGLGLPPGPELYEKKEILENASKG